MNKYSIINIVRIKLAIVSCCILCACSTTEIELCINEEQEHPHLAYVDIKYDWNSHSLDNSIPDSMMLIGYRVVNSWKCGYVITTKENDNKGYYTFNKPYNELPNRFIENKDEGDNVSGDTSNEDLLPNDVPKNSVETRNSNEESSDKPEEKIDSELFLVKSGDYRFLAFNYYSIGEGIYKFIGMSPDEIETTITDHSILVEYIPYDLNNKRIKKFSEPWYDYNPYSKYVINDSATLYSAYTDIQEILSVDVANEVTLTPKPINQKIDFQFTIERDSVVVDKIICEISGIPHKLHIMQSKIDPSKTYKMFFEAIPNSDKNEQAIDEWSGVTHYKGSIMGLGLVSSANSSLSMGAGILQMGIYTHTINSSGEYVEKIFNVGVNLYNSINRYGRVIFGREPVLLEIENILTLSRTQAFDKNEEDRSWDKWIIYDDINIDL